MTSLSDIFLWDLSNPPWLFNIERCWETERGPRRFGFGGECQIGYTRVIMDEWNETKTRKLLLIILMMVYMDLGVQQLVLDIHFFLRVTDLFISDETSDAANSICERALRAYFAQNKNMNVPLKVKWEKKAEFDEASNIR